ncbi:adhesion domain-containing protein, partial [Vibrio fluvialis]|uniref:adhesion domain-containing protein n=1 Tax=Vibrio fluvialis TaxID=676 RepID=UPI000A5C6F9A
TNANALCTTYNTLSLGGRTNWRLATRDELKVELYDASGNMFTARGWPTVIYYWSATATPDGSNYYFVDLSNGYDTSDSPSYTNYASCVSVYEP